MADVTRESEGKEFDRCLAVTQEELSGSAEAEAVESAIENLADMISENAPDYIDIDDGTVNDAVNDHRLSVKKEYQKEVEIKFLKHPDSGNIFPVNSTIVKLKHLVPCDETGRSVYDNRRIG